MPSGTATSDVVVAVVDQDTGREWEANKAFDFDLLTSKFVGRLNNSAPVLIESVRINSPGLASDHVDDDDDGASGARRGPDLTFKFGHQAQLFDRQKVLNLQRRHLSLAVFHYIPYISVTNVVSLAGGDEKVD